MAFWHGSMDEIEPGVSLVPRRGGYVDKADRALEGLFEAERPVGCLARNAAVFMVEDPDLIDAAGGYDDHVYEVLPEGRTGRHDLAWYTEAQCALEEGDRARALACAAGYWAGMAYPDRDRSLFECLAESALVVGAEPLPAFGR